MTTPEPHDDVVPLHTDFDLVWRGYDRDQVRCYVASTESELRLLTTDRDAAVARAEDLAGQLNDARAQIRELSERLDRMCRTPVEPDALTERLRRMVQLARAEAEEITTRARAAAEQSWASARQAAERLRRRQEQIVAELDAQREEMEVEHRQLIRRAHEQAEAISREAEQRRHDLDEQAARLREGIRSDFELAMSVRRAEAMRAMADERAAARARADQLISGARRHADRVVSEAQHRLDVLRAHRDRVLAGVQSTRQLLVEAESLLVPASRERESRDGVPRAREGSRH
ncbi:coiled-coil domain-containing protein [Allokutzneria albata]|uniref:DivIVA protein n=1 Tax=Allokutzneria albata TaxID=211114 RepID=A0A1G9SF31_ALLAB|nr:hypothetical protein [Allokutzneria albata]SDM33907.1 hypothetical protein SAMN04489726_1117 [Allokutzneria albata]